MIITLTYKEAGEVLDYLKTWQRIKARSEKGAIHFDPDMIEYDESQDEVKVTILS